mmetsp:Transcript_77491/g.171594  ORF Transcript_77491/g.171594 Transcript_77491/m.171594 type:complete len:419 (+) Transcript_77491:40-1296(+)
MSFKSVGSLVLVNDVGSVRSEVAASEGGIAEGEYHGAGKRHQPQPPSKGVPGPGFVRRRSVSTFPYAAPGSPTFTPRDVGSHKTLQAFASQHVGRNLSMKSGMSSSGNSDEVCTKSCASTAEPTCTPVRSPRVPRTSASLQQKETALPGVDEMSAVSPRVNCLSRLPSLQSGMSSDASSCDEQVMNATSKSSFVEKIRSLVSNVAGISGSPSPRASPKGIQTQQPEWTFQRVDCLSRLPSAHSGMSGMGSDISSIEETARNARSISNNVQKVIAQIRVAASSSPGVASSSSVSQGSPASYPRRESQSFPTDFADQRVECYSSLPSVMSANSSSDPGSLDIHTDAADTGPAAEIDHRQEACLPGRFASEPPVAARHANPLELYLSKELLTLHEQVSSEEPSPRLPLSGLLATFLDETVR